MLQRELKRGADEAFLADLARRTDFIEAHVLGDLLAAHPDFQILASVRDPIEQMISNYRHILREPANMWHRAAHKLSAPAFFDAFGDHFADHQTKYLVSAFSPLHGEVLQKGRLRAFHERFLSAVDRVRWLVPSEEIDAFTRLWSWEMRRPVPDRQRVNDAPQDAVDVGEIAAALRARPHLYAFDLLLHQVAKERFAEYRRNIEALVAPFSYPDNSRRAFAESEAGIWLTENWLEPEIGPQGMSWWSGPQTRSELRYRRRPEHKRISFDVTVVNGIRREDILVYQKDGMRLLETQRQARSADVMTMSVALADPAVEGELVLDVPDCLAPIMTTPNDENCQRRAFVATNWRLTA